MLEALFVTLHVIANLLWIGSIVSVGVLLSTSASSKNAREVAVMARKIYLTVSTPAFAASLIFGLARLLESPATYMRLHWFHGKLTAAIAVIAIHHMIGAKAKRVSLAPVIGGEGEATNELPRSMHSGKSSAILTAALFACASLAVAFVVFQSQLVP